MVFHRTAKQLAILVLVTLVSLVQPVSQALRAEAAVSVEQYVCPPCGCGVDDRVYDKPGSCPVCGMPLIVKGSQPAPKAQPQRTQKSVAILIFDHVEIIDYTGPYEVFGAAGLQVFTVATSTAPITTNMGMKVTPHYTLEDAPAAAVLLIPGGGIYETQQDPRVIKWIQERSAQAEYVMSVCNGAAILAKTGLLDGLTATTTAGLIDGLPAISPKIKVVRDRRYVDNGKFITTAGLSSGIDGAIYLVSKMFGKGWAQIVALGEEYDWKEGSNYARANLADRYLGAVLGRGFTLPIPGATVELLNTEGTPQHWDVKWQVVGDVSPADVLKVLNDRMVAGQWIEQQNTKPGAIARVWELKEQDGGTWSGTADAQPAGSKLLTVTLKIERAGSRAANQKARTSAEESRIVVRDAWIQEMPPSSRLTAAHMIIENPGANETALIGARAGIAEAVELHRAEMDNGVMRMRKLARIPVPIGKTDLTGELHIMLIGLKAPLKEGDQVALTLQFENSITKTVMVPVKKRISE
jgi:copper(I)-binding protein/putative intracellular protease/amidase/DNA-directed RNA polymerase subunit RPC12/RpoP